MNKLSHPILTNVLEVISAANESLNYGLVRQKALDAMFNTISADGAIFFLPDGNDHFTRIIVKNLDLKYNDYYKKYYYRMDPLRLSSGLGFKLGIDRREQTISYDSTRLTEYYNDFLKPQRIHHKLIVNLVAEKELHGKIVLTRPQNSTRFSKNEIHTAKTISPYLSHALVHNDLRRKMTIKGNLLQFIEKQSTVGVILLDESLQIVYRNPKATDMLGGAENGSTSMIPPNSIFSMILKDCGELKKGLKNCPAGGTAVPRQRMVLGPNDIRFSIKSKVLDQEPDWEGLRLFMVCIEEQSNVKFKSQDLIKTYHLSKREIDVISLLFMGLKNAQIAKKLFVSEVTVKKHLQNIYEKVGVKNRTSLINRILTS